MRVGRLGERSETHQPFLPLQCSHVLWWDRCGTPTDLQVPLETEHGSCKEEEDSFWSGARGF